MKRYSKAFPQIPLVHALLALLFVFGATPSVCRALENLDEMEARILRYGSNPWPTTQLEDSGNYHIWQPETLCYQDTTTGHEVWVLTHAPGIDEIFSREHGSNVWSYDGSKIGFFSSARPTANASLGSYHQRWIVNTDGRNLRAVEGFGRGTTPILADWGWARTENAYYAFGTSSGEGSGSAGYRLFNMTVNQNNVVSSTSLVLDTSSVNTLMKEPVKEGISTDDSHIVFRDRNVSSRMLNTPNPINTNAVYFAALGASPTLTNWWGIARRIGPAPYTDPYGDHVSSNEYWFHDVWSPGTSGSWILGQYNSSHLFVRFSSTGSYGDGGPLCQEWNGVTFGNNECVVMGTEAGYGTPDDPYGLPYFGHPVFDRWGRYALVGTYTDSPLPGTRIVDLEAKALLPNYVLAYNKYDGQHHSWTGWTDYVLGVDPQSYIIYANKWNQEYTAAFPVVHPHTVYTGNYNTYPRPSQSPDGTKVGFAATFLNNGNPYIQWAVVHYPLPPVNIWVQKSGTNVRVSWTRPSYTTRGWPNESSDPPPRAREIKGYHVWVSDDGTSGWIELTRGAVPAEYYDIPQPPNSTRYYAVTSEEFSRLESRTLSAVRRVTLDANGNLTTAITAAEGRTNFWTTPPPAPNPSIFSIPAGGNYRLTWSEPNDSKVRYYNIYYSRTGPPPTDQQHRIASVAVGTTTYIDWLSDRSMPGYYGITSVDRQGNEGGEVRTGNVPSAPVFSDPPVLQSP